MSTSSVVALTSVSVDGATSLISTSFFGIFFPFCVGSVDVVAVTINRAIFLHKFHHDFSVPLLSIIFTWYRYDEIEKIGIKEIRAKAGVADIREKITEARP